MNRFLVLLLALLTACSVKQQPLRIEPNRVLFHSTEISQTTPTATDSVKWIRPIAFNRGVLKIRYLDGHEGRIAKNSFWGYSDRKGRVYRRYRRSYLEVVQVGELVRYEEHTTTASSVNGQMQSIPVTNTYYSKTLDSPIYSSRKKAMQDTKLVVQ